MHKHFLQSVYWADLREAQGHKIVWIGESLLVIKETPTAFKSIGVMNQVDLATLDWEQLHKVAEENNLSHIHIDPNNYTTEMQWDPEILAKYHLIDTKELMLRDTVVIDLQKEEETLLAEMEKNTRYNCKYSLKHGVEVAVSNDNAALEIFLKIFFATKSQEHFFGRSEKYYRSVWNALKESGKARIAIASYKGQPLVARFLFLTDQGIFTPYTGYSSEWSKLKPTYAILWEIMRWGKQEGYEFINLWGIKPTLTPADQEYGYTKFKMNFSVDNVSHYLPSKHMIIDANAYRIFKLVNKLRWYFLRVKKTLVS